ncbi:uncharacterized protein LY79DRAFT_190385 [Colletotrichum navitas]|uniref:Uncharacterized protein n=1 Tax=Colletotrichum navitas TaxID=681940 RepID=A0AAD8Q0F1_9PEZI|nr:uncharacterized protein LY79DRAFT_190385 [Colletotrichum navitas]KAK1593184.1 hypothetical protein LY79DRAFT_190385 [Colletotrichum navitas]
MSDPPHVCSFYRARSGSLSQCRIRSRDLASSRYWEEKENRQPQCGYPGQLREPPVRLPDVLGKMKRLDRFVFTGPATAGEWKLRLRLWNEKRPQEDPGLLHIAFGRGVFAHPSRGVADLIRLVVREPCVQLRVLNNLSTSSERSLSVPT